MVKIEDFIVKEGDRYFADFEEWKNGNGISYEDGDLIRFSIEGKKHIGTLVKTGREENLFEIMGIREIKGKTL
jgi:hypothetical protein